MKRSIEDPAALRHAILEVMTEAALAGHDLVPFQPVDSGGCQSRCRPITPNHSHHTNHSSDTGLIYSLLSDRCAPLRP
jgi:hypothetical protein